MRDLPTGTVTFLFTDVEGSTKLLDELGDAAYGEALAAHRRVVRAASSAQGGVEVDTQGDAFFFAFPSASGALAAASDMTGGLSSGPIHVRIGLHTGEPLLEEEGYVGKEVHFAARVAATGHGGQIVLSKASAELLDDVELTDLGEHRLKDIAEPVAIYQVGSERFPPLKTISNTNLPRPASSFVGREAELSEVLRKIEQGTRLLTLTGPGGSGKTRLALEAATTLVPEYKAGVFWVGLSALRDPSLVTEQISQTLGSKNGLAEHIGEREMLLLIDNLEQVVQAASELSQLLQACPKLTLLCTSRELLRLQGEVEYPVPPLAEPEAVSLFCERSGLEPSADIAELCARLDSLPLAVELAAARSTALTPQQILGRLSKRLDLLKGGRDADPRQQTLRATIAWSYDLLSEEEQRLFRALSVFSGGCTLEAAEEVADADLDALQSLVEKSLLRFSNGRYWMLETIREFSGEKADHPEKDELARRHAQFVVRLVELAEPELEGPEQRKWVGILGDEQDNVRAALFFLSDAGCVDDLLELVGNLQSFWYVKGNWAESRRWCLTALDRGADLPTIARARVLNAAAGFSEKLGDHESTAAYAQRALDLSRELDYAEGVSSALAALSLARRLEGDYTGAAALLEEAVVSARESGDQMALADATASLAFLAMEQRAYSRAIPVAEEARTLYRNLGDESGDAYALTILANCLLYSGFRREALDALKEALPTLRDLGFVAILVGTLGLVACAAGESNAEAGAALMGAEEALRERISQPRTGAYIELHRSTVNDLRLRLGGERYEAAFADGRALSIDEAVDRAMEVVA